MGENAYTISADVEAPTDGLANGVVIAQGSKIGGWTVFVKDGRIYFELTAFTNRSGQLIATEPLRPGKSHIKISVTPDAGRDDHKVGPYLAPVAGDAVLTINGQLAGQAHFLNLNVHANDVNGGETLDIGCDLGSPVSPEYESPNRFNGKIDLVTIELK